MVEFNKMFVMLPVMLLSRKLDGEDPFTLFWLRVAYGVVQSIAVIIVLYAYIVASTIKSNDVVYVPQAASPFSDPNAKKKYTETTFGAHCLTTSRNLVGSTLFGIVMTVGFHYYKGMVVGLAMQAVMAPFNLIENPLIKALLWSGVKTICPEDKIFGEKAASDLTTDDEVVDAQGNAVVRRPGISGQSNAGKVDSKKIESKKQTLEEIMLDTWDDGTKADLTLLLAALTKQNVNTATSVDKWTPLMILSGLATPGTQSAIRQVMALGADVKKTDVEGWNCLHWAGFHGSVTAAKELSTETALLSVKDKEGNTPAETARKEGNIVVAEIFEKAFSEMDTKKDK